MSFRKSPLHNVVKSNKRLADLVVERIPDYDVKLLIGHRAEQMLAEVEGMECSNRMPDPATPDEVAEWLESEVEARLEAAQRAARADVLRNLASTSRTEAESLLNHHASDLFAGLAEQFADVMHTAAEHVAAMEVAATAAEAIQHGYADHWKAVTDLLPTIASIREAQRRLIGAYRGEFDSIACGDTPIVTDPEARLYLHRRLDVVAPGWRGGEPVPWPDDPAERLVWCIRRDSGAWVPTPAELNGLLTSPPALDAPSMLVESVTTMGRRIPSAYDQRGQRRRVDQSGHGFDTSGRGRPKPLSRTRVESVASASLADDD